MKLVVLLFSIIIVTPAWSQISGGLFTYEGVLTDTNGTPITNAQTVTFQIIHGGSCVAYEEDQNITPGSQGEFSAIVGAGTRTDATANTIDRIFASSNQIGCKGGSSFTVSGFPVLHIKVAAVDLTPDIQITHVPYAVNSQKLADKGPADFLQVNNLKNVTQVDLENFFGAGGFSSITNVLGGTYSPSTAGNVTGTVAISNGGTGATTQTAAINALLPAQSTNAGKYLTTDGTNVSWSTVAGTGITNLNGVTSPSQTLAVGSSGISPAWSSAASTHTLNFPMASALGVTAGLISKAEYDTFNGKLSSNLLTGRIYVGDGTNVAAAVTVSGDASLSNIGVLTLATVPITKGGTNLTALGTPNQILGVNGVGNGLEYKSITAGTGVTITHSAGDIQISAAGGGGGTVTSVSSANSDISVLNGTSTPSLTLNSGTGGGLPDANKIAKLDANGLLSLGMIPVIPVAQGGTGSSSWANYSVMGVNGAGAFTAIPGATSNTMLQWTVTGPVWTTATYPTSTTANQLLYSSANNVIGGLPTAYNAILLTDALGVPSWSVLSNDSFTQYALLSGRAGGQVLNGGTAANEKLTLESTASVTKGDILLNPNGGNVGIGTTTPTSVLHAVASGNKSTDYTGGSISNIATSSSGPLKKIGLDVQSTGVWNGIGAVNTGLNVNVSGGETNYAAIFNGGYVGIGTNNPNANLVVQGTAAASPKLFVQNYDYDAGLGGSAVSFALGASSGSAVGRIQTFDWTSGLSNSILALQPNGGKVGIGTTAPAGELEVVNTDAATSISIINKGSASVGHSPKLAIRNYSGVMGGAPRIVLSNSRGDSVAPQAVIANDVIGSIDFFANYDTSFSNAGGPAIVVAANGAWSNTSTPTYISFKTLGTGFNTSAEAMRIDSIGNVGIGISNPGSYKLYVNGPAISSSWNLTSDRRFKKNITNLNESLDKITLLRGVTYDWRKSEFPDRNFSEGKQIGLIAQEVEKIFPEVVTKDKDGFRAVQYSNLIAPVVEAIKELYRKLIDQQDYIEQQKRSIASLELKNNEFQTENIKMADQIEKLKFENQEIKTRLDNLEKALQNKK